MGCECFSLFVLSGCWGVLVIANALLAAGCCYKAAKMI